MRFLGATILFVILLASGAAFAQTAPTSNDDIWRAGARVNVVASGEHDVWAAGALVNVRGTIAHEMHAAGAEVTIDTTTAGDAYVAGAVVSVAGNYQHDLYVAGARVSLGAVQVKGDLKAGGARLLVGPQTAVQGTATLTGADVLFSGISAGKVVIYGDTVHIDGRIAGDLVVRARNVTIGKDAVIAGNAQFQTFNEPQIAPGATIHGRQTVTLPLPPQGSVHVVQALFGMMLFTIAAGFVAGLVLLIVRRSLVERSVGLLRTRPGHTFGIGVLVLLLIPLLVALLTATVIGIPTALLLLLALPLFWLAASVIAAFTMGDFLANRERRPRSFLGELGSLIIGVVVLTVIGIIPYVGTVTWLVALICGLGALWRAFCGAELPSAPVAAEEAAAD